MTLCIEEKVRIVDFAFEHVNALILTPNASTPLLSKDSSPAPALSVLYPHTPISRRKRFIRKREMPSQRLCLKSTGYSIQTLSRLARIVPSVGPDRYKDSVTKLIETARRQLLYCTPFLTGSNFSIDEIAVLLEGCCCTPQANLSPHIDLAKKLREKILNKYSSSEPDTRQLGMIVRSFAAFDKQINPEAYDDVLAEIVLEVLERRLPSGLLAREEASLYPISAAGHLDIIDALLLSYPYTRLEIVYEEAFDIFNSLYRTAFRKGCFSFRPSGRVSYRAEDIGGIIRGLYSLINWMEEGENKTFLEKTLHEFYIPLITEYRAQKSLAQIFPERIVIRLPSSKIYYVNSRQKHPWRQLSLCSSLLDIALRDDSLDCTGDNLDLFDILFSLL